MPARTLTPLPNGITTTRDALLQTVASRYAPVIFTVPDYETVIEVAMVSMGDQEHCDSFARLTDGTRNWDMYARLWVAYALVQPKLAEDANRRIEAEQIATILEDFPKDWIEIVFAKSLEMTNEYRKKRTERERQDAQGGQSVVFPRPGSGRSSLETDSTSSTPPSSP